MDAILIVVGVLVAGLLAAGLTYRALERRRRRRVAREALESARRQRAADVATHELALRNLAALYAKHPFRPGCTPRTVRAKSWPEHRQSIAAEARGAVHTRQSVSRSAPMSSLRDAPRDGFPGVSFGEPLGDVWQGSQFSPMWLDADSHVPSPSYAGRGGESGGAGASASWDSGSSASSTDSGSSSGSTD